MNGTCVNICFICNGGYAIPTLVAIASLKYNRNKENLYSLYIILDSTSEKWKKYFLDYEEEKFKINIISVGNYEANKSKNIPTYNGDSPSALLKFDIPDLLPEINKVLYLDGDIIIQKDLKALFNIDLEDKMVGAVIDSGTFYYHHTVSNQIKDYFNSGVILFDLKKAREENLTKILYETESRLENKYLLDQNVFNIVLENKVKLLSIKYNFLHTNLIRAQGKFTIEEINSRYSENYQSLNELKEDAFVIHYASKDKPWLNAENVGSVKWFFYLAQSTIYDSLTDSLSKCRF